MGRILILSGADLFEGYVGCRLWADLMVPRARACTTWSRWEPVQELNAYLYLFLRNEMVAYGGKCELQELPDMTLLRQKNPVNESQMLILAHCIAV